MWTASALDKDGALGLPDSHTSMMKEWPGVPGGCSWLGVPLLVSVQVMIRL